MNEKSYYLGAYLLVVAKPVPRQLYKQSCPACGLDRRPDQVSERCCQFCDVRWASVPDGDPVMSQARKLDVLPSDTEAKRLAQVYPVGLPPYDPSRFDGRTSIYLVPNLEEANARTRQGADFLTAEEITEKKANFSKFYRAEIDSLYDSIREGGTVIALVLGYGFFETDEI